ncbi:tannase/feruloyl esterase family alpha/beta hydrolase [Kiritimatiellaeota bacterium B1221]|nr:tannase/feruloyl esterase family alpha/beta hydrolase [Kiritimatiellaeota bacterium B1221]
MIKVSDIPDFIAPLELENLVSLKWREERGPFVSADGTRVIDLPPRRVVNYHLSPAPGSDIVVELWLPETSHWNGCFLGCGNGGAAGSIHPGRLAGRMKEGYAVAQTDMGTAAGPECGDGNPEIWKDFGGRATELMTLTAQRITEACYQRPADHSYFMGGSTGGQQALQLVQRHPDLYDGVIAELPAHCRTPLHAYFLWNYQILTRCPFSETQEEAAIQAAYEFFADREPFPEIMTAVSDPRCSDEEIEAVIALAAKRDASIGLRHQEALRQLFAGPTHPETGERIFPGVPPGCRFLTAQSYQYPFQWVFGRDCDLMGLNFAEDMDTYTRALAPWLNAENPDLQAFKDRGGVLLITSGSADAIVPYPATLDYVERIMDLNVSPETFNGFCRYFLIPGKAHGADGPGLNRTEDTLPLIREWREQGTPPDSLHCFREEQGQVQYEMELTPYPNIQLTYRGETRRVSGQRGGVPRISPRYL